MLGNTNQLVISPRRLLEEAFELASILFSHDGFCKWLGSYDEEKSLDDIIPQLHAEYTAEKLSCLLISMAIKIRILYSREESLRGRGVFGKSELDLGLICKRPKRKKSRSKSTELGNAKTVSDEKNWSTLHDLRKAANMIVHSSRIVFDENPRSIPVGPTEHGLNRMVEKFGSIAYIEGDDGSNCAIRLELNSFVDAVLKIYERIQLGEFPGL